MTKEEIIQILDNNDDKYLTQLLIYRRDNQFDLAVIYLQNELNCDKETAQQGVFHIYERFSNVQPIKSNSIKCPYCQSTNTKKLDVIDRGVSFGIFGFASSKVGKQWHCNSCRSDF